MNFLNNIDITFRIILFYTFFCLFPVIFTLIFGPKYFIFLIIFLIAGLIILFFLVGSFIKPILLMKKKIIDSSSNINEPAIFDSISHGDEFSELFIEYNKLIKIFEKNLKKFDSKTENSLLLAQKKEMKSNYYETLYDITRMMLMINNISQLINIILTEANKLVESEVVIFQKYYPIEKDFTIEGIKIFSKNYESVLGEIAIRGKKIPFAESFGGYLINKMKIISSEDIADKEKFSSFKELETLIKIYNMDIKNFVGIPLVFKEDVVGIVIFVNTKDKSFTTINRKFSESVFELLAYALKRQEIMDQYFIELQTGLYTYNYFYKRLKEEIELVKRYEINSFLVIISFDDFKTSTKVLDYSYNYVLIERLCSIVKNSSRLVDIYSLSGNNEIAVLLPDTGTRGSLIYGARLREVIEDSSFKTRNADNIKMTCSIGIFNLSKNISKISEPEFALESAREAMLVARRNGGNRIFTL